MDHSKHNHHHAHHGESEISIDVTYNNGKILIKLEDDNGIPPKLAIQHEKEMHFIIVSNDLEEYYHLHPEKEKQGLYVVKQVLTDGTYQAFVDISPVKKAYKITPNTVQVGSKETSKAGLVGMDHWTKEIDGKTVTLNPVHATTNKDVQLVFHTHGVIPDPHLGALGHVVVVDEKVKQYIHVHPESEDTTTFKAHFSKAGMYKIWAEFKFGDKKYVYPFVIEVTE